MGLGLADLQLPWSACLVATHPPNVTGAPFPPPLAAAAPRTAAGKLSTAQPRPSIGAASNATLTPEGLALLSPGLASKYACPSSGAPSEPGPGSAAGLPCTLPSGWCVRDARWVRCCARHRRPTCSRASCARSTPPLTPTHPGGSGLPPMDAGPAGPRARGAACRDLRLDYGRCSSDSPNLPIFGKTPRSASLPASTVEGLPQAPSSGTASLGGCSGLPGASPLSSAPRFRGPSRTPHFPSTACTLPCSCAKACMRRSPLQPRAPWRPRPSRPSRTAPRPLAPLPPGDAANCTGDLYGMLIRSNMGLAGAGDTPPDAPKAAPAPIQVPAGNGGEDDSGSEEGAAPARPSRPSEFGCGGCGVQGGMGCRSRNVPCKSPPHRPAAHVTAARRPALIPAPLSRAQPPPAAPCPRAGTRRPCRSSSPSPSRSAR